MNHIQGVPREQIVLFPEAVDDYITPENPIRFLEAFVESLILVELGFKSVWAEATGRPPYHPADLLKLYLYGYFKKKIRSTRKLEIETQRNLELFWLVKRLHPDFKTIANFRKDNASALVRVCREFTLLCKQLNLFSAELVAIDGSKFYAVNASNKNFTVRMLDRKIKELDQRIERYFKDMDEQDQQDFGTKDLTAEELNKKIEFLKNRGEQRRITPLVDEDVLDRMRERVRLRPNIMKLRREIVEHPFGTLKRWWDHGYFLMKGLPNVKGEMSLSVLAYNLTRAINIVGVKRLIEACSAGLQRETANPAWSG